MLRVRQIQNRILQDSQRKYTAKQKEHSETQEARRHKGLQIPKEVKLSLYVVDMVLHIRHPQKCLTISSKWQDIKSTYPKKKNQRTFYTPTINMAEKGRHTPIHSSLEEKKISRDKSNQKGERTQQLKLQISEEKKMDKDTRQETQRHPILTTKT